MAPEQVTGDCRLLDKKTDIFLLAATLYHIATLEPPYTGENLKDVLNKAEHRKLITPQKRNPDRLIPEELSRIIMKAAALHKENRYQNIQELINDLDNLIAGHWLKQEKKIFSDGQLLMQEGNSGEEAYLITKGRVQVFKGSFDNKIVLSILQAGDMVGEMALITNEKRSASVVALEDTEVAVLTKDILAQNLKKLPPYIEKMIESITHRLQTADANVHPHLAMDCTPFVLQQLCLILKTLSGVKRKFIINFSEIGTRISEDLGIPITKVEKALENAAQAELIAIKGSQIIIEDINKLLRSATLGKGVINK
jgi:serine/threonine-protein kinase